jgi:phenylacetate-CoA ligase
VLASLPILTKSDLQAHADELLVDRAPGPITRKTTGGSTGQAVTVVKDRKALAWERAAMWLGYGWAGVRFGDRCARFWGSQFDGKRRVVGHAGDLAMNRIRFSAFAFDDADLERYWQRCLAFQPTFLYGYVSMLEAFAEYLQRRGYDGCLLRARAVITTSEVLSDPQRDLLQRTFGVPVRVEYGCGEVGPVAYECEAGGLHLMSADLVVEINDPTGKPTLDSGEIILTDLNSRAMPLIRYRIGDNGVPGEPCTCGRAFPVLAKIWGRAYDVVEAPDGRRFHGEFFMYLFEDLRRAGYQVRQFQVIQDTVDHIGIRVVCEADAFEALQRALVTLLAARLPDVTASVSRVSRIDRAASGKAQVVRNLVRGSATA